MLRVENHVADKSAHFYALVADATAASGGVGVIVTLTFWDGILLGLKIAIAVVTLAVLVQRWRINRRWKGGLPPAEFPALVLFALFAFSVSARAAAPPNADPALAPWFQSLANPALGMSCCAEADGHILKDSDWRIEAGDHYQVKIAGDWQDVSPESVLDRVDNPTGGAVAFYPPGIAHPPIYCFVRPVET